MLFSVYHLHQVRLNGEESSSWIFEESLLGDHFVSVARRQDAESRDQTAASPPLVRTLSNFFGSVIFFADPSRVSVPQKTIRKEFGIGPVNCIRDS
jgi:hypothetical protein